MARVIAFANQKGGVAKTTTTLNLGVAFKEEGHRVLCIDLDPQGNLTMSQGWNPDEIERSMFDVLVHRLPITEIIRTHEIDIGVASIDLAGAELALSSMIGRERALEKALLPVRETVAVNVTRRPGPSNPNGIVFSPRGARVPTRSMTSGAFGASGNGEVGVPSSANIVALRVASGGPSHGMP